MWYHWRSVDWTTLRCLATSHTYLLRQVVVTTWNPWIQGSHYFIQWRHWNCCEQPTTSAEMPKGCLFPDLIPNRDVSQRYLAKVTRGGSFSTGGFHCLSHEDRYTWGYNHKSVHIYYIHLRTIVREVNKGLKCVELKSWLCWLLLPKERYWSLLELSPQLEPTQRSTNHKYQTIQKWPGVWGLLGLPTTPVKLTWCCQATRVGPSKYTGAAR